MMFFTVRDIRRFVEIVAKEIHDTGVPHLAADLTNPDADLWWRALQSLVNDVHCEDLAQASDVQRVNLRCGGSNIKRLDESNPMNMGVSEAARYLRVSPNTIYKWTSQGRIPFRKVGTKKLSFCKEELDRFIASRRVADDVELQERASRIAGRLQFRKHPIVKRD